MSGRTGPSRSGAAHRSDGAVFVAVCSLDDMSCMDGGDGWPVKEIALMRFVGHDRCCGIDGGTSDAGAGFV